MTTLDNKFNLESLKEINQKLNEIQSIAISGRNDDWKLASVLDNVTRAASMFCDVIEQHLKGNISTNKPLAYIEDKIFSAHDLAKEVENQHKNV